MWIELHMLQNFAPSCLNRDDTNSPKDCVFGGYRRARISSQCIKRATRTDPLFEKTVASGTGIRTKRLAERLANKLQERGRDADLADAFAVAAVSGLIKKTSDGLTNVLLYLSDTEIERLVDVTEEQWEAAEAKAKAAEGKDLVKALAGPADEVAKAYKKLHTDELKEVTDAADIALFGRMVADANVKDWNIDAACQVAHAISTHRAEMEMDFFTAVDDLNLAEEPGAGMMGTVEFNSSCFYRYALIDLEQLVKNLSDDEELAAKAVEGFIRASVAAIPTGKQNSMAAQNPPSFIMAVVKDGGVPWSLANAFEIPVSVGRGGKLVQQSIEQLAAYWDNLVGVYGDDAVTAKALCHLGDGELAGLAEARVGTVEDVVAAVSRAIEAGGS